MSKLAYFSHSNSIKPTHIGIFVIYNQGMLLTIFSYSPFPNKNNKKYKDMFATKSKPSIQ